MRLCSQWRRWGKTAKHLVFKFLHKLDIWSPGGNIAMGDTIKRAFITEILMSCSLEEEKIPEHFFHLQLKNKRWHMIAGFTAWLPQSGRLSTHRSGQGIKQLIFDQHFHISLISSIIFLWSAFSHFFDQHYNISLISILTFLWSAL